MNNRLLRRFQEYDAERAEVVTEISGLLGIPINGALTVEVPNRNSFVYVRLRNSTNELIQAFNEKVSPVYGLPVLVKWVLNRYEIISRDTNRYSDWGSFSAFLPRHGSQHSLNFEDGQGGDVTWIYSRQFMPYATVPSGTDGAGTVFVMPHVYRSADAAWNYIGDESSPNFLPAKPSGASGTMARMMLLVWDLSTGDPLIITGSFLAENLTGTSSVLSAIPTVTNQSYVPLAAIRLVSGTQSLLWDNIYDMRQYASITAFVTGSAVVAGVDTIGIAAMDDGNPIGTGSIVNFQGNLTAVRTGTVIFVDAAGGGGGGGGAGIVAQDRGRFVGTGTFLNFTDGLTASYSGTTVRVGGFPSLMASVKTYTSPLDDEFDSLIIDPKWTVVPGSTGTVSLIPSNPQNGTYDLSVRPSWLMMNIGTGTNAEVELMQNYVLPNDRCVVMPISIGMDYLATPASGELVTGLMLNTSNSDPLSGNPTGSLGIRVQAAGGGTQISVVDAAGTTVGFAPATDAYNNLFYFRIDRKDNPQNGAIMYHAFWSTDGYGWHYNGFKNAGTVTGTNIWIFADCIGNTSKMNVGIPWIREGTALAIDPWPL